MAISQPLQPIHPIQPKQSAGSKVDADGWASSQDGDLGPERMIFYGEQRAGKTYKYLSLIQAAHKLNPETRCFVFSTDESIQRCLLDFPYLRMMNVVRVRNCADMDELMKASAQIIGSGFINPGTDWIVVDLASRVWNWMPDYYCRHALKKPGGQEQVELEWQQAGNTGSCMISFYRSGINPMWDTWETKLRTKTGAHIILVCGEKQLTEEDIKGFKKADKNEVIRAFQRIGSYPSIQKDTPFLYHSIFYCSQPYTGKYYITTVGEKGREWIGKGLQGGRKQMTDDDDFGEMYVKIAREAGEAKWTIQQ